MQLETPYYLIDEHRLKQNLETIQYIKKKSGAKFVLALKCFSTWSVFDLMQQYMDGTTSSSLYEAQLGYEKFGKETHAYSVAYTEDEILKTREYASKIIFNSISQLERFYDQVSHLSIGIRVNPSISFSHFDLADPARRYSRLGVGDPATLKKIAPQIDGLMFHYNCENDDFDNFSDSLDYIGQRYKDLLLSLQWISLGGGIYFTQKGYPVDRLCERLRAFAAAFGLQIYLEPGEAAISHSAEIVTQVLDVVTNEKDIAIVDTSVEAHMLDLLVYQFPVTIKEATVEGHPYVIAGRSCLAGDLFGDFIFAQKLSPGDILHIENAAGYTMVKKNWFNGLKMPSIVVKRLNGKTEVMRSFDYHDFLSSLS